MRQTIQRFMTGTKRQRMAHPDIPRFLTRWTPVWIDAAEKRPPSRRATTIESPKDSVALKIPYTVAKGIWDIRTLVPDARKLTYHVDAALWRIPTRSPSKKKRTRRPESGSPSKPRQSAAGL